MIVLVAYYFGLSGSGHLIEENLKKMAIEVKANEPECLLYHARRSADNPDNFLLYEHYADQTALDSHRNTPHFQAIIEGTIIPLLEKRERALYSLAVS